MEKISFLYVSPIAAGKIATGIVHRPEPWIIIDQLPNALSLDVNFGLIIKTGLPYRIEFDVFYGEKSLLETDRAPMTAEPVYAWSTSGGDYVSIENMKLMGVSISHTGIHKIVATLYAYGSDLTEAPKKTHSLEGYFYITNEGSL